MIKLLHFAYCICDYCGKQAQFNLDDGREAEGFYTVRDFQFCSEECFKNYWNKEYKKVMEEWRNEIFGTEA